MKLSKNKVRMFLTVIFSLVFCWVIGQNLKQFTNENNIINSINESNIDINETIEYEKELDIVEDKYYINYEGEKNVVDNPWNISVGKIELEDEGKCVFLTPNTGIFIDGLLNIEKILFKYQIHDWVKDLSDGAGLVVQLMDKDENVLLVKEIIVDNKKQWESIQIDVSQIDDLYKIMVLCNNGHNNDDNGDWIVIKDIKYFVENECLSFIY